MIIKGDCLELLPDIPDGSVDMVLADPPYGTTACKWDSIIPIGPMWEQIQRVVKKEAAIVLTASQPFTTTLISSNQEMFKYSWVWEKEQSHTPLNSKCQPLKVHEDIIVFSRGAATYSKNGGMNYYPQMVAGIPYRGRTLKDSRHQFHGSINVGARKDNEGTRFPRSVIFFKRSRLGVHPTEKPVELMEYLVKTYTQEGDTVLDFCMGSGTTGVACMNTDRNFIGIEKESEYFDIAERRMRYRQPEFAGK